METVDKEQKIQMDQEKSKKSKKYRREEPEKEPTKLSPKISSERTRIQICQTSILSG